MGAIMALPLLLLPFGGWLVESGSLMLARCTFKSLLGIPCMGCGATRATLNLLHGDMGEAFYFSPMIVIAYTALALWGLVSLWLYIRGKQLHFSMRPWMTWAVRGSLLAVPFLNWFYLIGRGI